MHLETNWTILEASSREVLEAYLEALRRDDLEGELFWRPIVVERLGLIRGAVEDYFRDSGIDGA